MNGKSRSIGNPHPSTGNLLSTRHKGVIGTVAVSAISALALSGCASGGDQIDMVGFAVPAEANNAVFDAFTQAPEGEGLSTSESYGASGDQSRAVANGQPADFVHFSIEPDVTRLVDAGLVEESWNDNPQRGMLTNSVVVLVVREGNPENITDWEDLAREDVGIVTPNPGSSGAARWNILGAWASQLQAGHSEADAESFLEDVIANVEAFPGSGRDATTAFLDGTGDVLISYENEAILGLQEGESYDYIVPDRNLLIENPAAVTEQAGEDVRSFYDFALSAEGQQIYAGYGFRPLENSEEDVNPGEVEGANDPADPFPQISELATIDDDFGGWDAVVDEYFDEDGTITRITEASGLN